MPVSDGGNAVYTTRPWTIAATILFCGVPLGEADLVSAVVLAPLGRPTEGEREYNLRRNEKKNYFMNYISVVSFQRRRNIIADL